MTSVDKGVKLTKAQRWVLQRGAEGFKVYPSAGYEVHTSFATGEVYYKAPRSAIKVCERNDWLVGGSITPAGRQALSEAQQ